MKEEKTGH